MTKTKFLTPSNLPPTAGYSHIAITPATGRMAHISGQIPMDSAGNLVGEGDFAAQATQSFENLKSALQVAGATFGDVVKINMYVTDMANLMLLREVRDRYVDLKNPPASTLVQVAAFVRPDIMFEVDAVAALKD